MFHAVDEEDLTYVPPLYSSCIIKSLLIPVQFFLSLYDAHIKNINLLGASLHVHKLLLDARKKYMEARVKYLICLSLLE